MCPLALSEPYLQHKTSEAAPKRISRRTSYLLVRLAFHPYPQVIQLICNSGRFAPSRGVTLASRCPWVAHQVSGLRPATQQAPCSDSLSLRLRNSHCLTLPRNVTRRLILQ